MGMPPEVERVVRRFFRAVFTGDGAELAAVSLPRPDLAALSRPRPAPAHLGSIEEQLAHLQGSVIFEREDRIALHVYFRGMVFPVTLVPTPAGLRVDPRFWIAGTRAPTEESQTARAFLFAVLTGDRALLAEVALENPAIDVLVGPPAPAGEMAQYENVASSLPMLPLAAGDEYPMTPDRMARVTPEMVGPDRAFLLTELDGFEVPLPLRRTEGRWRVDPGPWIRLAVLFRGGDARAQSSP